MGFLCCRHGIGPAAAGRCPWACQQHLGVQTPECQSDSPWPISTLLDPQAGEGRNSGNKPSYTFYLPDRRFRTRHALQKMRSDIYFCPLGLRATSHTCHTLLRGESCCFCASFAQSCNAGRCWFVAARCSQCTWEKPHP